MTRKNRFFIAGIFVFVVFLLGVKSWHLLEGSFSLQRFRLGWLQAVFTQDDQMQEPQHIETIQGWSAKVKGVVKGISKVDIDKSGKNPRFIYFITVLREDSVCKNCDFELEQEIKFRVKEKQILEGIDREVKRGDRVYIETSGVDRLPRMLRVNTIRLIE